MHIIFINCDSNFANFSFQSIIPFINHKLFTSTSKTKYATINNPKMTALAQHIMPAIANPLLSLAIVNATIEIINPATLNKIAIIIKELR